MSGEPFSLTMEVIPDHGTRMKKAASMGKEGGPNMEQFFSEILEENAWISIYGVVAAMAGKRTELIERIIYKHPSWVVRSRAVQALSKLDQERTAAILTNPASPRQLKGVALAALRICSDEILEAVVSDSSWGGINAAISLLDRTTRGSNSATMKKWLVKLMSMSALVKETPKELEQIYQGMAAKYGEMMLQLLREQTTLDEKWYRACLVLCRDFPDEMLAILESNSRQGSFIWYITKPLIRYRPAQVITVLTKRGIIDDAFLRAAKKVWTHNVHRHQFLAGIADILKRKKKSQPTTTKFTLVGMLTSLKKKPEKEVGEILLDIYCNDKLGKGVQRYVDQLKTVCKKYDVEPSKDQLVNMIKLSLTACFIPKFEGFESDEEKAKIIEAWDQVETDFPELVEKTLVSVCSSRDLQHEVPKKCALFEKFYQFVETFVDGQEYPELTASQKCRCLGLLPFHEIKERITFLLSDRDVTIRRVGLKFYWDSGVAVGNLKTTLEVLRFLEKRLKKEQDEVRQMLIPHILCLHPTKLIADAAPTFELLFNMTVKWGKGSWSTNWLDWCSKTWIHFSAVTPKPENQLLVLATQIISQLRAAEHVDLQQVFISFAERLKFVAFSKKQNLDSEHSIDEPGVDIVLSYLADTLEELGNKWTYTITFHKYSSNILTDTEIEQLQSLNTFAGVFLTLDTKLFFKCERIQNFCQKHLDKIVFETSHLRVPIDVANLQRQQFLQWPVFKAVVHRALKTIEKSASGINWVLSSKSKQTAATAADNFISRCPMMMVSQAKGFFRMGVSSKLARYLLGWTVPHVDLLQTAVSAYIKGVSGWLNSYHTLCNSFRRIISHLEWAPFLADVLYADATNNNNCYQLLSNIAAPTEFTSPVQKELIRKYIQIAKAEHATNLINVAAYCHPRDFKVPEAPGTRSRTIGCKHVDRRPRFRFQRGDDAKKRKEAIKKKKALNKKAAETADPTIGTTCVDLLKACEKKFASVKCLPTVFCLIYQLMQKRYQTKVMTEVVDAAINLLFACIKNITKEELKHNWTMHGFDSLSNFTTQKPELLRFFQENIKYNPDAVLRILLLPMHTRQVRADSMLTKGCGGISPSEAFRRSEILQQYAVEHRQDLLPGIILGVDHIGQYQAFVKAPSSPRFSGQEISGGDRLFCLKPSVQSVLWKKLASPTGDDYAPYFKYYHHKLWLGASLPCPDDFPSLDDDSHPFRQILTKSLEEAALLEEIRQQAREGVEKNQVVERSKEEIDQEVVVSMLMQIHTELFKAVCAFDNPAQALALLKEHLDCGVAAKTVIPSIAMSLACLPPADAFSVLDELLGRKHTKVSARQQLSRTVVKLLETDKADQLIRQEWRDDSWLVVGEEPDPPSDKAVKVAIICSLIASPLLRKLPKLWETIESIGVSEDLSEEHRYIARELLASLSGTNEVATLNLKSWPYCGAAGLPGLCAKFLLRKTLEANAAEAIQRWIDYIVADPTYVVNRQDAEQVLDGLQECGSYPSLLSSSILTLYERGYKEAFSRTVSRQTDTLIQAIKNVDETAVSEALQFFTAFAETKPKNLVSCLKGAHEAIELLAEKKITTPTAVTLMCSLLNVSAEDHIDYVVRILRKIGWDSVALMKGLSQCTPKQQLVLFAKENIVSECDMTRFVCASILSANIYQHRTMIIPLVEDQNDHIAAFAVSVLTSS
eukprot:TRINITY_DN5435_c0_g1_i1.p1 TRINITY_DN5435_c0_g1~~TRINITY_DN5435_c0_g1_i1.p1  ORF type:complete len:1700 (+),score=273.47 TRINITY_DN5435_c0_g1_i1:54-5102(+)